MYKEGAKIMLHFITQRAPKPGFNYDVYAVRCVLAQCSDLFFLVFLFVTQLYII